MRTNYNGNTDLSLNGYVLGLPEDLKIPTALKKTAKAYDDAFTAYSDAEVTAELSRADLAAAAGKDKAALIAALEKDKPDPGTSHYDKAIRAAEVADERVRVTARNLTNAANVLETAIRDNSADVLAGAIEHDRALIAEVSEKWARIAALTDEVDTLTRRIGVQSNAVLHMTGNPVRIEPAVVENTLPPLRHRDNYTAVAALDRLAGTEPTE